MTPREPNPKVAPGLGRGGSGADWTWRRCAESWGVGGAVLAGGLAEAGTSARRGG